MTTGKWFYAVRVLGIKTMNYIICVVPYKYTIWDGISEILADLLGDKCIKLGKPRRRCYEAV